MQKSKGKLYIFEGIDGVGKTTIVMGLCEKLSKAGIPFSSYSFPGKEPGSLGKLVYDLHHNVNNNINKPIDPISLQLLHIAAHIDIINTNVLPDLHSGKIVLLDRSWWSTYAYGLANGICKKTIKQIIAPEIDVLKEICIGKIFLIQRYITNDNNLLRVNSTLKAYNELKDKYTSSDLVEEISNNNEVTSVINNVYDKILVDYNDKLVDYQLNLFDEQYSKTNENCSLSFFVGAPKLIPSSIYDTYWRFAVKRQDIFFNRINSSSYPWTDDVILQKYKFTNAYRASDRVSQYLIKNVIYNDNNYSAEDTFFRIVLFKLFNKIETWDYLKENLGEITYKDYSFEVYDNLLTRLLDKNEKLYSAAYIMPSGKSSYGSEKKHRNNLKLLEAMMDTHITQKLAKLHSLKQLYDLLLDYPTLGKFLAFQYSIDINYSELCNFDEMSFVVAGPGARSGIAKCFNSIGDYSEEEIIHFMAEKQCEEFDRLGLSFKDLWGRPLQLIDCQNLFCETDKYTRVAFPYIEGDTGRKRIKQLFSANSKNSIDYFYPPKWGINQEIEKR